MANKRSRVTTRKETSIWGRFFNSLRLNRNIIIIALVCVLVGVGGTSAFNLQYYPSVKGESTQTAISATTTPAEIPSPMPEATKNLLKDSKTQTQKDQFINNSPKSNNPPPVNNSKSEPTPAPRKTCDQNRQQLELYKENDRHDDQSANLANTHRILVENYQNIINSPGCRSADIYQSACADAQKKLDAENAIYQDNVEYENSYHQKMLNFINSWCY